MNTYKTVIGGGQIGYGVAGRTNEIGDDFAPDLTSIDNPKSGFLGIGKKSAKAKEKHSARVLKREANHIKRVARRKAGKGFFQGVWKTVKRFNPLSQMARLGVLFIVRANLVGMATRIYPAFLTDAELTKRNFNKANAKKAKDTWDNKLSKIWEKDLGGKAKNLEHAIKSGYEKPIFRSKKKNFSGIDDGFGSMSANSLFDMQNAGTMSVGARTDGSWEGMGWQYVDAIFEQIEGKDGKPCARTARENLSNDELALVACIADGLENPKKYSNSTGGTIATAALGLAAAGLSIAFPPQAPIIGSGCSVAGILVKVIDGAGLAKNPYDANSPEGKDQQKELDDATTAGDMNPPQINEAEYNKIVSAGQEDAKKGGEGDTDEIWGMPSTFVYVGGAIMGATLLILGIRTLINREK